MKLNRREQFVGALDNPEYVEITQQNRLKLVWKIRILPHLFKSGYMQLTAAISSEIKCSEGENNSDCNVSVIAES